MDRHPLTLAAFSILIAGPSLAGSYSGTCTSAPKEQWMTEAAAQAVVVEAGYTVKNIKTTRAGNCYEAYVVDKHGNKLELFLDPTSGKIVHSQ